MHNWAQAAPNKKNTQLEPNDSILPANRYAVDEYLDGISDLDLILASIQPPTEPMDTNLADLASVYVKAEEVRLEGILRMLDYEIDGPDTIALIIGRHQIERNLFPVLYILLKRHLEILHKAREVVLSRHELTSALESYYRLRFGPPLYLPDLHNLSSDQDIEYHASYKDILETNAPCVNPYATTAALTTHSIYPQSAFYGCWTGHLRDHTGKITPYGMIEVFLDSDLKDGRGSYSAGTLDVSGKKEPGQDITLHIQGSPDDPIADRAFGILFQGQIQTADGQSSISGEWKNVSESGAGVLVLRQIPAWLHRLTEPSNRSPRSLLKLALSAVRYQVRLNRKGHLIPAASIIEMRRGAELSRYQYMMGDLDPFDDDEFQTILWNSTPWDARVYRSAARRSLDWTLHT
ncbi:hypothetical protein B0H17DRAFT_1205535 [Mycena rosella]|uniref:Uncharacterized protein n=1 Tax=Mycena rosella TaxID=1033263 RepID=A0AAD7GDZ1_MYCRO|nr:hypothetical protein B0H17DRAFT_1205535 [Mycena rosella]